MGWSQGVDTTHFQHENLEVQLESCLSEKISVWTRVSIPFSLSSRQEGDKKQSSLQYSHPENQGYS